MRFLRIPINPNDESTTLPDWVIRDLERERERDLDRREAPRLEMPDARPHEPPREPEKEQRNDGGTVIVIDI